MALVAAFGMCACCARGGAPTHPEPTGPVRTVVLPAATGGLTVLVRDSIAGRALVGAVGRAWVGSAVAFAPHPTVADSLWWPVLPMGEYVVEVRRIAYEPARRVVRVDSGRTTTVEVPMVLSDMCDLACSAVVVSPRRWWQFWRR